MARALSLPDLMKGSISGSTLIIILMRPLTRSSTPCVTILCGTCSMSMPAISLNISPARCEAVPLPAEGKVSSPGWRFASAINSLTVFTGIDGCTTSTSGADDINMIGARSFSGS